MQCVSTHQLVPELFQPDRRGELTLPPQQAHHFAVGAKPGVVGLQHFLDQGADGPLKAAPIRLPIHHESPERLIGIGKQQPALPDGLVRIDACFRESRGKCRVPLRGGDYQQGLTLLQSIQQEIDNVSGEQPFVGLVKLNQVSMVLRARRKAIKRYHGTQLRLVDDSVTKMFQVRMWGRMSSCSGLPTRKFAQVVNRRAGSNLPHNWAIIERVCVLKPS